MSTQQDWALADRLAKQLGIKKNEAYNGLSVLRNNHLIERILSGDTNAIVKAHSLDWYGHRPQDRKPEELSSLANAVKLMLWTIDKIGNVEDARDAFNRAAESLK